MPVGAGRCRSGPVGAGAGAGTGSPRSRPLPTGTDRCRPVPTGAGAADRPQESLYELNPRF